MVRACTFTFGKLPSFHGLRVRVMREEVKHGVVAGIGFGCAGLFAKSSLTFTTEFSLTNPQHWLTLLLSSHFWCFLLLNLLAIMFVWKALKKGRASMVVGVSSATASLACFLGGVAFFHETFTILKLVGIILLATGFLMLRISE